MSSPRSPWLAMMVVVASISSPALGESNPGAFAPHAAKSAPFAHLRLGQPDQATRLHLPPLPAVEIAAVKRSNALSQEKRLQIGIGRSASIDPNADSAALVWTPVAGGFAAQWVVTSPGASALRIGLTGKSDARGLELRFAGRAEPQTVYGPVADPFARDDTYWGPVLSGESGLIEVFIPGNPWPRPSLRITQVSHIFVHPADPHLEKLATGTSDSCEVDLICRSATNSGLANTGAAVARMTFMAGTGSGGTYLCTGTLLNAIGGSFIPYFYSAAHCLSSQFAANTLTTHWFFERTGCGSGATSVATRQLIGGATLLYADTTTDVLFLRLKDDPPADAWFAGWDATTVAKDTPLTGIHHPRGDWKKVSLGSMCAYDVPPGHAPASFLVTKWDSTATGVTEPGSSGSGIFTTADAAGTDFRLRGGLWGGPSTCTAIESDLYDYYSRLDIAYPAVRKYLNPPAVPTSLKLAVVKGGNGSGTVTTPLGGISCGSVCSAQFARDIPISVAATPQAGSYFAGWSGACAGTGACTVTLTEDTTVYANFNVLGTPGPPAISPSSLQFPGQSLATTSTPLSLTVTNSGAQPISVSTVQAPAGFSAAHDCGALPVSASCTVTVRFTPTAVGLYSASLVVQSTAGTQAVALAGRGDLSLVAHYYQAILRREADPPGRAYWENEADRLRALGANVNEAWYAMAAQFFASPEYVVQGRNATQFVTDLYTTFFNRQPDSGGLSFWADQLRAGMPREVALVSFMLSPEFVLFTQGLFGSTTVRPEIDTVMDFYRGLLSRLPDTEGFNYWMQQFRSAQCAGDAVVYSTVDAISSAYISSPEYAARGRTNAQYVGDLYNAFLRRGGDLAGVQYWIGLLDAGAVTRDGLRRAFMASAEFNQRVASVVAAGCYAASKRAKASPIAACLPTPPSNTWTITLTGIGVPQQCPLGGDKGEFRESGSATVTVPSDLVAAIARGSSETGSGTFSGSEEVNRDTPYPEICTLRPSSVANVPVVLRYFGNGFNLRTPAGEALIKDVVYFPATRQESSVPIGSILFTVTSTSPRKLSGTWTVAGPGSASGNTAHGTFVMSN